MLEDKEKDGGNDEYLPDWSFEANLDPLKPDWEDRIPHELWELGEVFFPIPPGTKGWNYPHSMQEKRYSADSEILNGWLCQGWSYGIACAGDLIVVDIDDLRYLDDIVDKLPETFYQITGSREGYHLFYMVEGFDTRQNLYSYECNNCGNETPYWNEKRDDDTDITKYYCPECGHKLSDEDNKVHLGEVKADPHGYVVGPGSLHPSGNKYGPLKGDKIARVDREVIENAIDGFKIKETFTPTYMDRPEPKSHKIDNAHPLYNLKAEQVLPYLEEKNRIAHPVHGSEESNANFMLNEGGDTFICWRCQHGTSDGCGLSAAQYLACEELGEKGNAGDFVCEDVRGRWHRDPTLHYYAWKRAIQLGLIEPEMIPFKVIKGFAIDEDMLDSSGLIDWDKKVDCINALEYLREHNFEPIDD